MNEDVRLNTHVSQMLESVELAMSYVDGLSQAEFIADRKTQQAAILNRIVIGETAAKIERDFPAFAIEHAHIPWKSMRGMRNRIAQITLKLIYPPSGTRRNRRCPSCKGGYDS